jgi:hypothetical protein
LLLRHPAISLDQLAGAPGCFSGCARAKASIVESELAIRMKFQNGAVSTEKYFAPAAWLARQMSASVRVAVAIAAGGGVFQVRFERGQRGRVPMLAPFDAGRLIELEFVFQIFTGFGCVWSRYSMIASDSNRIGPSPSIKAGSIRRISDSGRTSRHGRLSRIRIWLCVSR